MNNIKLISILLAVLFVLNSSLAYKDDSSEGYPTDTDDEWNSSM